MASGKTTLGRALARITGRDFIDLDFYIEQRFRKKIPEIFAERGEEGFRRLESAMLREAGEFENVIISCGGGTPCHADNMEYMNSRGVTIRLEASIPVIVRRILLARGRRPIADKVPEKELPDFVKKHLAEREPFYSQARFTIASDELENVRDIDRTALGTLNLLKNT